jgi:carbonic anhydrase
MCQRCLDRTLGRRAFLQLAAAGAAAGLVSGIGAARAAEGAKTTLSADEALARLVEGNRRYVADAQLCSTNLAGQRTGVASGQAPWAVILSCSDSRVQPELLFGGIGLGELFVARNAGNMADTATLGTIEYGVAELGAPLVMVLGHQACGAVVAACDVIARNTVFPGSIGPMIEPIIPAALAVRTEAGDMVDNAVRESARRTAASLPLRSTLIGAGVATGKVKVVAAYYALATGAVQLLS